MKIGHIYFLTNSSMPGLLKIGFTTTSLSRRLAELETTGVPEPFLIGAAFLVSDAPQCERRLHELFDASRKAKNREFFEVSLPEALARSLPVIQSMIFDRVGGGTQQSPEGCALTAEEREMLCRLVHDTEGNPLDAGVVAHDLGVHVQKVLLGCARLLDMGLIREHRDRLNVYTSYSLTHKGRKYCFDHGLVINELLD